MNDRPIIINPSPLSLVPTGVQLDGTELPFQPIGPLAHNNIFQLSLKGQQQNVEKQQQHHEEENIQDSTKLLLRSSSSVLLGPLISQSQSNDLKKQQKLQLKTLAPTSFDMMQLPPPILDKLEFWPVASSIKKFLEKICPLNQEQLLEKQWKDRLRQDKKRELEKQREKDADNAGIGSYSRKFLTSHSCLTAVGCFRLDLRPFVATILPNVQRTRAQMERLIPLLVIGLAERLSRRLELHIARMMTQISSLPTCCAALAAFQDAEEDGKDILNEHKYLAQLDSITVDYEIPLDHVRAPQYERQTQQTQARIWRQQMRSRLEKEKQERRRKRKRDRDKRRIELKKKRMMLEMELEKLDEEKEIKKRNKKEKKKNKLLYYDEKSDQQQIGKQFNQQGYNQKEFKNSNLNSSKSPSQVEIENQIKVIEQEELELILDEQDDEDEEKGVNIEGGIGIDIDENEGDEDDEVRFGNVTSLVKRRRRRKKEIQKKKRDEDEDIEEETEKVKEKDKQTTQTISFAAQMGGAAYERMLDKVDQQMSRFGDALTKFQYSKSDLISAWSNVFDIRLKSFAKKLNFLEEDLNSADLCDLSDALVEGSDIQQQAFNQIDKGQQINETVLFQQHQQNELNQENKEENKQINVLKHEEQEAQNGLTVQYQQVNVKKNEQKINKKNVLFDENPVPMKFDNQDIFEIKPYPQYAGQELGLNQISILQKGNNMNDWKKKDIVDNEGNEEDGEQKENDGDKSIHKSQQMSVARKTILKRSHCFSRLFTAPRFISYARRAENKLADRGIVLDSFSAELLVYSNYALLLDKSQPQQENEKLTKLKFAW
ncbi:MAG: hypothetical protein EZS28_020568, partial [Streblomastix strix]